MRYSQFLTAALGLITTLSACADFSTAVLPRPAETVAFAASMPIGIPAAPPQGLIGFCLKYLVECSTKAPGSTAVVLDAQHQSQLELIQAKVNATIAPRDVPGHAWDYPTRGYGECNEYALEKRRELVELGWPRESLLLTAALTERGEGHLVLVARTTAGDLVLDNRRDAVTDWSKLPYHWVSQQSAQSLAQWVSFDRPRTNTLLAGASDAGAEQKIF
jgi:predicted transglutaminase-like cysteine proteinase